MNTNKGLVIIIAVLTVLLLWSGWWGLSQRKDNQSLTEENTKLQREVADMEALRLNLESEVDSLQSAFESLAEENEFLQGSVENAQAKINQQVAAIRNLKKRASVESGGLRAQIEELLGIKTNLENQIASLQTENDSLRTENQQLSQDLASSQAETDALTRLNRTIQDELKRLTLNSFKASGFRVEVEKRKPRATSKSRQARRILASFDLVNVPEEYRGVRPIYLVITDDKGTPVQNKNPIQAQITVNGDPMDLIAVASRDENIVENQRISFTHDLEERLRKGYYRVAVYTDIGLLGASSFRLR